MKKQLSSQLNLGHTKFSSPWYQELLQKIKPWAASLTVLLSILGAIALFYQHIINLTDRQARLEGRFEEIKSELNLIREVEKESSFYSPK